MSAIKPFIKNIPDEISINILSYLNDVKDLANVSLVSHAGNRLANDPILWQHLFEHAFHKPVPEGISPKLAFSTVIPVGDLQKLCKVVTAFYCNLKWDTKRRLECHFPQNPEYHLTIEQSFGPNRGTLLGFEGKSDETECYRFIGTMETYSQEYHLNCWNNGKGSTTDQERYYPNFPPIYLSSFIRAPLYMADDFCLIYPKWIPYEFFLANIHVDVGYGNILAYFSSINDWKDPFKLICISPNEWVGLIPYFDEFKFAKADPLDHMSWEAINGNRIWNSLRRDRPYDLAEYFQYFPIEFNG